ncbi:MAG: SIS domain-containing protein [Rubrobacteraceae bacterium]
MGSSATKSAIFSQPEEIERLVDIDLYEYALRLADCNRIWLVGTGTSLHAAELGAAMFAEFGMDARPKSAMDFVRFSPTLRADDGVVVISHTAETAFALSARARAIEVGSTLVSITRKDSGWPEAIETVTKESSETYTVSYTTTLLVLAKIAASLDTSSVFGGDLSRVSEATQKALEYSDIEEITPPSRALVLAGVGPAAVTAREGALKVREASRVLAEGYDAEYLLHGSAVPLGSEDCLVLLRPPEDPDGLLTTVGQAAEAEGVIVFSIEEPACLHPLLSQIPLTVRLQILALRFAKERGHNADVAITGAWTEDHLWDLGAHDEGLEIS